MYALAISTIHEPINVDTDLHKFVYSESLEAIVKVFLPTYLVEVTTMANAAGRRANPEPADQPDFIIYTCSNNYKCYYNYKQMISLQALTDSNIFIYKDYPHKPSAVLYALEVASSAVRESRRIEKQYLSRLVQLQTLF